jgi:hypothetical protein
MATLMVHNECNLYSTNSCSLMGDEEDEREYTKGGLNIDGGDNGEYFFVVSIKRIIRK